MSLLLIPLLVAQVGSSFSPTQPNITIDKPILSITGQGKALLSVKATEYKIILYADTYAVAGKEARESSELIREKIINTTKELGGSEKDVVLTNVNTLQPIEGDEYYRVEQDIQIWLRGIENINKVKEAFLLLNNVQIGSITPVISETSDYTPAIIKARKDALMNAKEEANALAAEVGVLLGEPVYITESIVYPTYTGYETSDESEITVSVTIYYEIMYKK